VAISKARDVNALLIAMSILPSHASSMRAKASKLPPASATAMLEGEPISFALAIPAWIIRCASSSDTD